jgi:DNA-binding XRE family transcriptional regulator
MPIIDTPTLFGRCIAVLRRELMLTQAEFGDLVGLTREGVTRVESGRATLTFYALIRLSYNVGKVNRGAAEVFEFFELCIEEMNARGIKVLNRARRPGDILLATSRVDRIVAHVYENLLAVYIGDLRQRHYNLVDDEFRGDVEFGNDDE